MLLEPWQESSALCSCSHRSTQHVSKAAGEEWNEMCYICRWPNPARYGYHTAKVHDRGGVLLNASQPSTDVQQRFARMMMTINRWRAPSTCICQCTLTLQGHVMLFTCYIALYITPHYLDTKHVLTPRHNGLKGWISNSKFTRDPIILPRSKIRTHSQTIVQAPFVFSDVALQGP